MLEQATVSCINRDIYYEADATLEKVVGSIDIDERKAVNCGI